METIRFLLFVICFAFVCRGTVPDRNLLKRVRLVEIAEGELGVKELSGHNDGPRVEEYLATGHLKSGAPWCAAFISWIYGQAGFLEPRTGWSPALFPNRMLVKDGKPGDVLGIYFPDLKRIAHCGLVTKVKGSWIYSVEGNTNKQGSREGNGVYRRMRHVRTIKCFSDWSLGARFSGYGFISEKLKGLLVQKISLINQKPTVLLKTPLILK